MKILLTGASGLLGHNVLRRLVNDGHEVVALVRRPDAVRMEGGGWQVRVGELTDYNTLVSAATGCDALVNCAGVTDMSLLRYEDYLPVNCDLCRMFTYVMKTHGISTLVHVSTVNTIGCGSPEQPSDEQAPMSAPFKGTYYAESKREGEKILLDYAKSHPEGHVVVINPGYIIGPYDVKPSSGRMLLAAYRKPLMVAVHGGKCFVPAIDVADAVAQAVTRGRNGSRYIVTGKDGCLSMSELYALQAKTMGYRQRVVVLPNWLVRLAGRMGDVLRAAGVKSELSTANVRQLLAREYYDNSHGLCDLAYKQTTIEHAITDFYQWKNTIKS